MTNTCLLSVCKDANDYANAINTYGARFADACLV